MTIKLTTPAAVAAALAGMLAAAPAIAADYVQAPGSTLVFANKYDGTIFTGSFPGFQTTLSFDPANPAAGKLDVSIPLAGAKSGNSDRDSTLQGKDFFNVAQFAQARGQRRRRRFAVGQRGGFRHASPPIAGWR